MILSRGQQYTQSGLMDGYVSKRKEIFNKNTNPQGEVSFSMAENVRELLPSPHLHIKLTEF
jgi:hypothetical protein